MTFGAVHTPEEFAVRSLHEGDFNADDAGRGAPAGPASRWRPLLSWRDHPVLLEDQRLLRDVDNAAAIALGSLQRTLADRGSMADKRERELLTALVGRMEAVQAVAAESGDDLHRYRAGLV
jgi:hypothetical protein